MTDMGLGDLSSLLNGGVVGISCGLAVWYVVRLPALERERHEMEQQKLAAEREHESKRALEQRSRDAELREWHGNQVTTITKSVEKVADAVDRLEARVAELPCKKTQAVLPGGSCLSPVG